MAYSRYKTFIVDGAYRKIPFIEVPSTNSDIYVEYKTGVTRFDLLSYQYYGDANYGWLILQANPHVGSLEFKVEDGVRIRVPYPLESAIQGYETNISKFDKLYGLDI